MSPVRATTTRTRRSFLRVGAGVLTGVAALIGWDFTRSTRTSAATPQSGELVGGFRILAHDAPWPEDVVYPRGYVGMIPESLDGKTLPNVEQVTVSRAEYQELRGLPALFDIPGVAEIAKLNLVKHISGKVLSVGAGYHLREGTGIEGLSLSMDLQIPAPFPLRRQHSPDLGTIPWRLGIPTPSPGVALTCGRSALVQWIMSDTLYVLEASGDPLRCERFIIDSAASLRRVASN